QAPAGVAVVAAPAAPAPSAPAAAGIAAPPTVSGPITYQFAQSAPAVSDDAKVLEALRQAEKSKAPAAAATVAAPAPSAPAAAGIAAPPTVSGPITYQFAQSAPAVSDDAKVLEALRQAEKSKAPAAAATVAAPAPSAPAAAGIAAPPTVSGPITYQFAQSAPAVSDDAKVLEALRQAEKAKAPAAAATVAAPAPSAPAAAGIAAPPTGSGPITYQFAQSAPAVSDDAKVLEALRQAEKAKAPAAAATVAATAPSAPAAAGIAAPPTVSGPITYQFAQSTPAASDDAKVLAALRQAEKGPSPATPSAPITTAPAPVPTGVQQAEMEA